MADKQDTDKKTALADLVDENDTISSDRAYSHRRGGLGMFITYAVIALLFAMLVVFAGRWLYHRIHKTNPPQKPTTSNTTTPAPVTPPTTTPSNPTNSSSSSQPSTNTSTTSQTAAQTPNTGSGNVIALFVGTAILVGGLHFVWSVRRA